MPEDGGLIGQALIGLKPVNAWVHTYTKPQTSSTRSRGLGWRIHESVEDTKLSTNKQHSLSLLRTHKPGSPLLPCSARALMPLRRFLQPILDCSKLGPQKSTNPYPESRDPEFLGPGMSSLTLVRSMPVCIYAGGVYTYAIYGGSYRVNYVVYVWT